jgi:hypothetical protein
MPQQEATAQELTIGGGGNNSGGSFTTGSTCLSSGTFVAENRYLRHVIALAAGEIFPPFVDGKKITWTSLTSAIATSKTADGGFTSVKVEAGAA